MPWKVSSGQRKRAFTDNNSQTIAKRGRYRHNTLVSSAIINRSGENSNSFWNWKALRKCSPRRKGPETVAFAQGNKRKVKATQFPVSSRASSPGPQPRQESKSRFCYRNHPLEGRLRPTSAGRAGCALLTARAWLQAGDFLKPSWPERWSPQTSPRALILTTACFLHSQTLPPASTTIIYMLLNQRANQAKPWLIFTTYAVHCAGRLCSRSLGNTSTGICLAVNIPKAGAANH